MYMHSIDMYSVRQLREVIHQLELIIVTRPNDKHIVDTTIV